MKTLSGTTRRTTALDQSRYSSSMPLWSLTGTTCAIDPQTESIPPPFDIAPSLFRNRHSTKIGSCVLSIAEFRLRTINTNITPLLLFHFRLSSWQERTTPHTWREAPKTTSPTSLVAFLFSPDCTRSPKASTACHSGLMSLRSSRRSRKGVWGFHKGGVFWYPDWKLWQLFLRTWASCKGRKSRGDSSRAETAVKSCLWSPTVKVAFCGYC